MKDIEFVKQCLDNYFNYHQKELKMEGFEHHDFIWKEYSCEDSTLSINELNDYEKLLPVELPSLFKLFLQAYSFPSPIEIRNEEYTKFYKEHDNNWSFEYEGLLYVDLWIFELPKEEELERYKEEIDNWRSLLSAGYIPFAEWQDLQGPVCFDIQQKNERGDYAIVWFDHEHLINLGEEDSAIREKVSVYSNPLFNSFRELLEVMFYNREIF